MGTPSTDTNVIAAAVKIMRPALCPISSIFFTHFNSENSATTTRRITNAHITLNTITKARMRVDGGIMQ